MPDPSTPPVGADPPRFRPITVTLPGGGRLLVRVLGEADVDAVLALYDGLDPADRRLRFFSSSRPSARFVARWLDPSRGLVLGAFVGPGDAPDRVPGEEVPTGPLDRGPEGRLVGEAGYALLANGNGELGITTAADWRGWLGPFLLDVLASAAHDAGVTDIEADVRLENRAMLGLIRHRGAVVVNQPFASEVRLLMSTGGHTPGWSGTRDPARVRVLVESAAPRWSPAPTDADLASLEVLTCPGPRARPGGRCPLLEEGRCPLVDGAAHVVVVTGSGDDGQLQELADAHRRRADGPPVHTCGVSAGVLELLRRLADQPDRR